MNYSIDINADVGEMVGNETILMPYLSSCNIACGGHIGNTETMTEVVGIAKKNGVKIGAHPSYPDPTNFGRKVMELSNQDLYETVRAQIMDLQQIVAAQHTQLHHVKPHGALYNVVAKDEEKAMIIVAVLKSIALPLVLYAPYGSVMARIAQEHGIRVQYEGFMDRAYTQELTLVPRNEPNAVLTDAEAIFLHLKRMVCEQHVKTIDGTLVPFQADTYCIHGDNHYAIHILEYVCHQLQKEKIAIV